MNQFLESPQNKYRVAHLNGYVDGQRAIDEYRARHIIHWVRQGYSTRQLEVDWTGYSTSVWIPTSCTIAV